MNHHIGEKTPKNIQGIYAKMFASGDVNAKLLRAILALFPTISACAKAFGVEYGSLLDLVNRKISVDVDGVWRPICETVAHNLGYSVAELMPPDDYPRTITVGRRQAKRVIDVRRPDVPTDVDRRLLNETLRQMLHLLSFRPREILALRYGFGDIRPYTLQEAGEVFNISIERVRQIEIGGLAKLKRFCDGSHHLGEILFEYHVQSEEATYGPAPDENPPPS